MVTNSPIHFGNDAENSAAYNQPGLSTQTNAEDGATDPIPITGELEAGETDPKPNAKPNIPENHLSRRASTPETGYMGLGTIRLLTKLIPS